MTVIAEPFKEYPGTGSELVRKTLDEIQRLCIDHLNKRISSRELSIALKAINGCVSGLLSDNYDSVLDAAIKHADEHMAEDWCGHFRVFSKEQSVALVAYKPEERGYTVVMMPNDSRKFTMPTDELHPYKRAYESASTVVRKLVGLGYIEVK